MKIAKIELKNFRQFIDTKIEFSCDQEKNVTIILGDNGTGKTTLAQAFCWCLYGKTNFTDRILLNRLVANSMSPSVTSEVMVKLTLKSESLTYCVYRRQEYGKNYDNSIYIKKKDNENTSIEISCTNAEGNTNWIKSNDIDNTINEIIPSDLSKYFFFDGEQIESFSKEVSSGEKSKGMSEAVESLTGLKPLKTAIEHLSPSKRGSVVSKFNSLYSGKGDKEIDELNELILRNREDIEKYENAIDIAQNDISIAKRKIEVNSEKIKEFQDAANLQIKKEQLEKQLNTLKNNYENTVNRIIKTYNCNINKFLCYSPVARVMELLCQTDFRGKDIPEIHSKTIEFLLKRKMCICKTHLDEGSQPYLALKELMNYLPPHAIEFIVGSYVNNIKKDFRNPVDLLGAMKDDYQNLDYFDDQINETNKELSIIDKKLSGGDVVAKVNQLHGECQLCRTLITKKERESSDYHYKISECKAKIERSKKERDRLVTSNALNAKIELRIKYATLLYESYCQEYENKKSATKNKLEAYINEYFQIYFDGKIKLKISDKYNISVTINDIIGNIQTSTAQGVAVVFSFLSSIIRIAKENRAAEHEGILSNTYPLVMDAPLSSLDKTRIKAVCSTIPNIADQVIVFIKNTDGEVAEEYLGTKIGKKLEFKKENDYVTDII